MLVHFLPVDQPGEVTRAVLVLLDLVLVISVYGVHAGLSALQAPESNMAAVAAQ